jgi:hypothetical protein
MDTKTVVIIILLILILILVFRKSSYFDTEIPKHIWTYWDDGKVPDVVQKCMGTWKKHNPDYEVTLLTRENLKQYLPDVDIFSFKFTQTPQQVADLVRVHVLAKHGGVWADSTIIMNRPLVSILNQNSYEFIGYFLKSRTTIPETPYLENWFFACKPNSSFINMWRDEMVHINTYKTIGDYIKDVRKQDVDLQGIEDPNYLWMHVAAAVVMQKKMTKDEVSRQMKFLSADDGPFKFMFDNDWDSMKGVKSLCDAAKSPDRPVFFKLRGGERKVLDESPDIQACLF